MKRIVVFMFVILASFFASFSVMTTEVSAAGGSSDCDVNFLGFVPWYNGMAIKKSGKCEVDSPTSSDDIAPFVTKIILNVLIDLTTAVGYFALGFTIYGGYLYITAGGDPGKVAKGKKTLVAAVIGTAIALLASVIMNLIVKALSST